MNTNTTTATTSFGLQAKAKKKVIAATTAGLLAVGSLVGAGYAAWLAPQGFEQHVNIADAVQMEYTINGGSTWVPFDGTTVDINLGLADGWKNFTPGQTNSTNFGGTEIVQIRQKTAGGDAPRVRLSNYELTTTGAAFEGATPATSTVSVGDLVNNNGNITTGTAYPLTIDIEVPSTIGSSYYGAEGTITLNVEVETYTI